MARSFPRDTSFPRSSEFRNLYILKPASVLQKKDRAAESVKLSQQVHITESFKWHCGVDMKPHRKRKKKCS